jgi:hypothetical protein
MKQTSKKYSDWNLCTIQFKNNLEDVCQQLRSGITWYGQAQVLPKYKWSIAQLRLTRRGNQQTSNTISFDTDWLNIKGDLQSDLRMCTKEPTFYDTNSLTMFWVLEKPDYCFLIIYYTLEAWKYK